MMVNNYIKCVYQGRIVGLWFFDDSDDQGTNAAHLRATVYASQYKGQVLDDGKVILPAKLIGYNRCPTLSKLEYKFVNYSPIKAIMVPPSPHQVPAVMIRQTAKQEIIASA